MENNQQIKRISVIVGVGEFSTTSGYRFERIFKNGSEALVAWIQVIENGKVIAEFIESNCNLYF